jgi:predicted RNase H-like HicB family nuclease
MLTEFIKKALALAHYELIQDKEPYYGEVSLLPGVWSTGKTLEECRDHLEQAIEDWLLFSLAKGYDIPDLDGLKIQAPKEVLAL